MRPIDCPGPADLLAALNRCWLNHLADPRGSFLSAAELAGRAVAVDAPALHGWARLVQGLAGYRFQAAADTRRVFADALASLNACGDSRGARLARLGEPIALLREARRAEALSWFEALQPSFQADPADPDAFFVYHGLAVCAIYAGRIDEALTQFGRLFKLTEQPELKGFARAIVCVNVQPLLLPLEEYSLALHFSSEAEPILAPYPHHPLHVIVQSHRISSLLRLARRSEAQALLEVLLPRARLEPMAAQAVLINATELFIELRDFDRARLLLAESRLHARAPSEYAHCDWAEGALARAEGRPDEALVLLREACAKLDRVREANTTVRSLVFRDMAELLGERGQASESARWQVAYDLEIEALTEARTRARRIWSHWSGLSAYSF
ncbi:hypothetical protein [Chitinimonas lacunae]|uniref:Tetratricopeptide repeat protein n=1 Tax=Chitinimonas lacunae TaxID=1963018 RepID=A0ABV8MQD3_9NEIS